VPARGCGWSPVCCLPALLGAPQQLFEEQRVALGTRDAVTHELAACVGEAAGERIVFDAGRQYQDGGAFAHRAGEGSEVSEREGIRPVDVLDDDEERLSGGEPRHELRHRFLLAAIPVQVVHGVL
jgi:hypothetical protein